MGRRHGWAHAGREVPTRAHAMIGPYLQWAGRDCLTIAIWILVLQLGACTPRTPHRRLHAQRRSSACGGPALALLDLSPYAPVVASDCFMRPCMRPCTLASPVPPTMQTDQPRIHSCHPRHVDPTPHRFDTPAAMACVKQAKRTDYYASGVGSTCHMYMLRAQRAASPSAGRPPLLLRQPWRLS